MAKKQTKPEQTTIEYLIKKDGLIHGIIRRNGEIHAVPRNLATAKIWHNDDIDELITRGTKYDSEDALMADFEVIK